MSDPVFAAETIQNPILWHDVAIGLGILLGVIVTIFSTLISLWSRRAWDGMKETWKTLSTQVSSLSSKIDAMSKNIIDQVDGTCSKNQEACQKIMAQQFRAVTQNISSNTKQIDGLQKSSIEEYKKRVELEAQLIKNGQLPDRRNGDH